MIKGIGVDICDLRRLNHLDQLAKKILHVDEFSLYLSKYLLYETLKNGAICFIVIELPPYCQLAI